MGIVPAPTSAGKQLTFEGTLQVGTIDYTFTAPGSTSIWFSLKIDSDGNGTLDTSPAFVYLRAAMVHPTAAPFAVGLPKNYSGALTPSVDFRIGIPVSYPSFILWGPSISELGG
jgi:hypothetical protein